jgi:hypothetical protein
VLIETRSIMPATYEIDTHKKLVVTTAWGLCTADDVLRFRRALSSDSNFDPSFCQLADFTRVTQVKFTPDDVRMLAEVSPFSLRSRRALVAGDILRSLRGEHDLRVFRNRCEAMAWLMEGNSSSSS